MFEALEKVEKEIKKPLLRSDKKGMDLLVAEFEKGNKKCVTTSLINHPYKTRTNNSRCSLNNIDYIII